MRPAALVAAATLGVAAWWWVQSQNAAATDGGVDNAPGLTDWLNATWDDMTTNTTITDALRTQNMRAFLVLIRTGEGTIGDSGYRTLYGGGLFDSYVDHPPGTVTAGGLTSSAAGAYQILAGTWREMQALYGLPDFSPASQDVAAVGLIKRRGALGDVLAGRFDSAIAKCAREWASLPGSPYGQPVLSLQRAHDVLAQNGVTEGVMA